jgi:hypothetical protein
MKELLKEGLNVDSKDHHGKTTVQVAMAVDNTRFSWGKNSSSSGFSPK